MSAPSDDALFSPAVAPVTRSYAVISDVENEYQWLEKGTVVQVNDFIIDAMLRTPPAVKAKRAGHTLKRLICHCCPTVEDVSYQESGVIGVLAEAADVGRKAQKAQGGYVVITLALENAAEVSIRPDNSVLSFPGLARAPDLLAPTSTLLLKARPDLNRFRVATVLAPWKSGDAIGAQVCLHPQIFTGGQGQEGEY